MSAGRRVAAVVAALTIGANLGTSYVLFATGFLNRFGRITDRDVAILYVFVVVFGAVTVSYVSVGFLLAGRPGAGRVATVLLAGGATIAAWSFGYVVGGELVFHAPQGEFANAVLLLGPLAIGPGFALILPGLALAYPTGRLPSRRWNLPVGLVVGAMAAGSLVELILPGPITPEPLGSHNPFGIDGLPASLAAAAYPLVVAAIAGVMVLGVAAVLTRYRSGDVTLRQQLRWFIAAVLLAAVPLPISIVPGVGGPQWALVASVGLMLVPIAVGIAVTRYRLYEIDRLISRTIGWAVLTCVLLAVFGATVVGLQALLASFTQGQTLAVAASTLVAFALFQPVRRRVQSGVDHRFDRSRYDGERTAAAFAERLRDQVDLASLSRDIAAVVDTALRPTGVSVWLRKPATDVSRSTTP